MPLLRKTDSLIYLLIKKIYVITVKIYNFDINKIFKQNIINQGIFWSIFHVKIPHDKVYYRVSRDRVRVESFRIVFILKPDYRITGRRTSFDDRLISLFASFR